MTNDDSGLLDVNDVEKSTRYQFKIVMRSNLNTNSEIVSQLGQM